MTDVIKPIDPLLRKKQVIAAVGVTERTIDRELEAGRFPKPVRITQKTIGWRQSEIVEYIESRPTVGGAL